MDNPVRKTIVVSAVNLRKGGTLTILKDCLEYLSSSGATENYRVVALVHDRTLCDYPGIEYIEAPDTIKSWFKRLRFEYLTMYSISKKLSPVYLWLSLHDTTPNVNAERQAVYCHNPFPFYQWKWRELFLNYKIVLFAWFSKWIYRINIHKNFKVIVQQEWIRNEFRKMFSLDRETIIVAMPPKTKQNYQITDNTSNNRVPQFLFASFADIHKNFETLLEASFLLEQEIGQDRFEVTITIEKDMNKYTKWLWSKWGDSCSDHYVNSVKWVGFLSRAQLYEYYSKTDCLVFPSKVETWGLPITEFAPASRAIILPELPYSHETAAGCEKVSFFDVSSAKDLSKKMKAFIDNNAATFVQLPETIIQEPVAYSWDNLFQQLLN